MASKQLEGLLDQEIIKLQDELYDRDLCATVGQMTEAMIEPYLEHHFDPRPNDDFKMEPD